VRAAKTPIKEQASKEKFDAPKVLTGDIDALRKEELRI